MKHQKTYLLTRLRAAGRHGAHSGDLRVAGIGNPSQRVNELEAIGHVFRRISEPRDGCPGVRYVLISEAVGAADAPVETPDRSRDAGREPDPSQTQRDATVGGSQSPGVLFDLPARPGLYDTERAA